MGSKPPGRPRVDYAPGAFGGAIVADRYIAVAGNIGAGKTTLTTWLTNTYGMLPVFEPFENNPYLDDFYKDMGAWGFHSQMWFLSNKYRLHTELEKTQGVLVQDRTIYEDAEIFAQYLYDSKRMSERDWETYQDLYQAMKANLRPPDLVIYLKCSVKAVRRRIKQRGRASEQDIPLAYLKKLNALYEQWMGGWKESPILEWDSERLDYLSDMVHAIEFQKAIQRFL